MRKRLSKEQIKNSKSNLQKWYTPEEMESYLREANACVDSESFFNQAGLEFLRDAYVAAKVANLRGAKAVRLIAANNPDFEIRFADGTEKYEVVEADISRKRGDEYKTTHTDDCQRSIKHDPEEEWHKRAADIPSALRSAIDKKVRKVYPPSTNLVVFLNIAEWDVSQSRTVKLLPEITAPALDHFDTVWVLWKEKLYGPWSKI
jgi:hypothetical protein